jgi:hypothetical protein
MLVEITEIGGNDRDLNVVVDGQSYGVWQSDRGRWAVANIDGHVWTVRTKEEALAKVREIASALAAKAV